MNPQPAFQHAAPRAAISPTRSPRGGRATLPPRPLATRQPATAAPAASAPAPDTALSPGRLAELLESYTPVVLQIVGGFQRKLPRNVLRDDLVAAGMCGLWDAIRRHGSDIGESFEFYVRVRIRGAIVDELRTQDWLPRRARALATEEGSGAPAVVRLDDMSEWEQQRTLASVSTTEAVLDARAAHESLVDAIQLLPERERHIVSMHYFNGVKFKDLGAELGVSEPRISQLHSRAVARLRGLLAEAA